MRKPLAIIGMSPGNSYFKDYEVRFLLQEAVNRFGQCAVMVADIPAISTYIAFGYTPNRARNKAVPKGNNLKNRTRRIAEELGYSPEQVVITDWADEVENNPGFREHYRAIEEKYKTLPVFAEAVRSTTQAVLDNRAQTYSPQEIEGATHYLLSEIAFMEFAPQFFNQDRVCYLYHRNWKVYEDYINGKFDGRPRDYLDFLLLEAPYETYIKANEEQFTAGNVVHDTYSRVTQSGTLRAAHAQYPPAMMRDGDTFSGVFYEIIRGFADKHALKIEWVEETGYGVLTEGLEEGRFDIFASAVWPTPERHKKAALSHPVYYSDVGVWVRAGSAFEGQDWLRLNDPSCRIAITDGDITHSICLTDFVRAKWIRVPQLDRVKGLMAFVADGRADATMVERTTYEAYAGALAVPLVNIAREKPIRRYSNSFLVGKNQHDFLDMINDYIVDLLKRDQVRPIVKKYTTSFEGLYFPEAAWRED
jgi:polar amino acid transport system substrate-binding protein